MLQDMSRAEDRRHFEISELQRSVAFRATVIERLRATLDRKPARRLPETWREYERRCASARVVTECAIEREERARAFEAAELARLAPAAA
jgi:hypothetical protein